MRCRNCRFGRRRTGPAGGDGLMRAVQSGLSQQFVELSTLRTRNYLIDGDQIRVDGALEVSHACRVTTRTVTYAVGTANDGSSQRIPVDFQA
ncbi:MAG: hypothetical protein QOF66_4776 [Mycobacterium sp.]|jgi:hypothetical protein|nr:hypothetical protein [Mycobacterium sp.]MDT5056410.1 hypothetical protein [Mycobacterium sp.]